MSRTGFGIMQGRLVPPEDGRFQSFPCNSWRQEITRAREAGKSCNLSQERVLLQRFRIQKGDSR